MEISTVKPSHEIEMTPAQERALEYAVRKVFDYLSLRRMPGYQLRSLTLEETKFGGGIWMSMEVDNGKPGTLGFDCPHSAFLHIGKRGGYTAYRNQRGKDKSKKYTGREALIYCEMERF